MSEQSTTTIATGSATPAAVCPSCGNSELRMFHTVPSVPAHSVLLLSAHASALSYPRGTISLGFCPQCGLR